MKNGYKVILGIIFCVLGLFAYQNCGSSGSSPLCLGSNCNQIGSSLPPSPPPPKNVNISYSNQSRFYVTTEYCTQRTQDVGCDIEARWTSSSQVLIAGVHSWALNTLGFIDCKPPPVTATTVWVAPIGSYEIFYMYEVANCASINVANPAASLGNQAPVATMQIQRF